jgi:hypothetical protein
LTWEVTNDFHGALSSAIRSSENYAAAKETVRRSKRLKRESDELLEASHELLRGSKSRVAKRDRAASTSGQA